MCFCAFQDSWGVRVIWAFEVVFTAQDVSGLLVLRRLESLRPFDGLPELRAECNSDRAPASAGQGPKRRLEQYCTNTYVQNALTPDPAMAIRLKVTPRET